VERPRAPSTLANRLSIGISGMFVECGGNFLKTKTCFITNFFADVRCQSFCHIHLTSDNFLAYLRYLSENQVLVHTNSEESCTKIWKTDNNHRIFAMSKDNNDRK